MTPQEARAMWGALIDSSRLVEDLPDGPRDFVAVVGSLANFIENERLRSYNEGVDAGVAMERARCVKIAEGEIDPEAHVSEGKSILAYIQSGGTPVNG